MFFDYIRWEVPPTQAAVVALCTFFVNEPEFVQLLKSDPGMLDDLLKVESENAQRCGLDLGRAKHMARVVRSELCARAALEYIESLSSPSVHQANRESFRSIG